jgi:DNA-binding transcriptional ArsR family regulator
VNKPADITDPVIAKAYAHPLRIEIMGLLDNRVASPRQLAAELGSPLSLTSYHVRQLASMGLVDLVSRRQKRGSIEHFYTAVVRPRMYDDTWARIPTIVKRAIVGGRLSQLGKEVAMAAGAGSFDREDMHFTRTRVSLTPDGWKTAARILADALAQLDRLKANEAAAVEADPHTERIEATAVMMLFDSSPSGFDPHEAGPLIESDELADLAPPDGL